MTKNEPSSALSDEQIVERLAEKGDCFMKKIPNKHEFSMVGFFRRRENSDENTLIRTAILDEDGLSKCKHEHRLGDPRDIMRQLAYCAKCQCAVPFRLVETIIPQCLSAIPPL